MSTSQSVTDLLYLMACLRDEEHGCPWDIKQTFDSIVPHTLEEAYEVADAIEKKDYAHLKEELGDLLFQVVFYSQLGTEKGYFTFDDITTTLVEKLVRRHPHVFPSGELYGDNQGISLSEEEISQIWEKIKQQERDDKAQGMADTSSFVSVLNDIPATLPAMQRAEKLQKRASNVGFDWQEPLPVIEKIEEELAELKEAIQSQDPAKIQDEMGDVLFATINLSRKLNVKSEMALRSTNAKFTRRFQYIEAQLQKQGIDFEAAALDQLEALWQQAKQGEE